MKVDLLGKRQMWILQTSLKIQKDKVGAGRSSAGQGLKQLASRVEVNKKANCRWA